jgi:hypothetical protein
LSSVVDHENSMFQTAENKNSFTQTLGANSFLVIITKFQIWGKCQEMGHILLNDYISTRYIFRQVHCFHISFLHGPNLNVFLYILSCNLHMFHSSRNLHFFCQT